MRETSWANIRDRMAVGHFQVAHVLAPMPIAANLGLTPLAVPTIAPMALGLGGNAVTVSNALWALMVEHGATPGLQSGDDRRAPSSRSRPTVPRGRSRRCALPSCIPTRATTTSCATGSPRAASIRTRDVEIVIVPPPLMADALASGAIDGYCVGEPWSTAAALQGFGRIVTVKAAIWRSSPEKVLSVGANWAADEPGRARRAAARPVPVGAMVRARPAIARELAQILSGKAYLARPAEWMLHGLTGELDAGGGDIRRADDFFVPFAKAATFPWKSHALWFYSQMVRWGQVAHTPANAAIARETYRPDLYRAALKPLGVALPAANAKVEGALRAPTPVGSAGASLTLGPDGFFDGASVRSRPARRVHRGAEALVHADMCTAQTLRRLVRANDYSLVLPSALAAIRATS